MATPTLCDMQTSLEDARFFYQKLDPIILRAPRPATTVTPMRTQASALSLCVCFCLALTERTAAAVSEADFEVPADRVDVTVDRLAAIDFAEVVRPAAAVLARRQPRFAPAGRDPRLTDAEHEAHRRKGEDVAYTVARLVWARRTADRDSDAEAVARVLGELATDRFRTDADVRRVAIQTLAAGASGPGPLTDARRKPLYDVAVHNRDDAALRASAAQRLMVAPPSEGQARWHDDVLRHLPGIVRAQPTLAARHAAFNDLTNIGNRLHRLPVDHFAALVRVGFDLIEETPPGTSAGAYGTSRRLGYMLKRPGEFAPPQDEHRDATRNLAPSFFVRTVENARQWWGDTGKRALDAIAPVE